MVTPTWHCHIKAAVIGNVPLAPLEYAYSEVGDEKKAMRDTWSSGKLILTCCLVIANPTLTFP